MKSKRDSGNRGEQYAVDYLVRKGYRIRERNYWKPWGEIDIIAEAGDTTLVFVEVKTMHRGDITPEHNMTPAKIMKTKRAALAYANAHPELSNKGWRIDVIAIDLEGDAQADIRHYINI